MGQFNLRVLGSPEVACSGKALKFPTRKSFALLIYLILEDGLHSREKLAAIFWPEREARLGRASLRNTLGYLRIVLGQTGSDFVIQGDELGFRPGDAWQSDVQLLKEAGRVLYNPVTNEQIALLKAAVDAYRGDFLEGFSLKDAPAFDAWSSLQRESWHRQITLVCDHLSQLLSERGQLQRAISIAARWLGIDAWNEATYRRLMQLHAAAGDRTAALRVYANCQAMLAEEFGSRPDPETESLAARLRSLDHSTALPRQKSTTLDQRMLELPFTGRAVEHQQLVMAFEVASQGQPGVVILTGEAGIGKTRLARQFLAWLSGQRVDVVQGKAFETSGRLPYQPLVQALRDRLERENAPRELLNDVWLAELSRLLPELRQRYPDLPPLPAGEDRSRANLFEAVARLGQALAERAPLVLFIDDIQWADLASLDVLSYSVARWSENHAPVLLLFCLRIEALETNAELKVWLADMRRNLPLTRLTLEAFSPEDVQALVQSLVQPENASRTVQNGQPPEPPTRIPSSDIRSDPVYRLGNWLFAETRGQPFFMLETLKTLFEKGILKPDPHRGIWQVDPASLESILDRLGSQDRMVPAGIQEMILARAARLSPEASTLLLAAAVLGQENEFSHLRLVAALEEGQGLRALEELLASRLLVEKKASTRSPAGEPRYGIPHDQARDVIYSGASEARRRLLNRRAFETLMGVPAAPAVLAHHALKAGLLEQAFQYSIAAGDQAMAVFAVRDAIAHYLTARGLGENNRLSSQIPVETWNHLYQRLGRAYELQDDWQQAGETYQAMLDFIRAKEQPEMECQALNRLAAIQIHGLLDLDRAAALLQEAQAVAERSGDQTGMAETALNLAFVARNRMQFELAREHARRALELARQVGHPELAARSLSTLAYAQRLLRDWEAGLHDAEQAYAYYAAAGDRAMEVDSLGQIGTALLYLGRPRQAAATLRSAYETSFKIENRWGQANCGIKLAHALLDLGEYGQAQQLAQQSVRLAQALEHPHLVILSLMTCGTIQRSLYNLEEARALQEQALEAQSRASAPLYPDWALSELCALSALRGDWPAAHAYALQSLAARGHSALPPIAFIEWLLVETLLRGGDATRARAVIQDQAASAAENPRYRILYLRSKAALYQQEDQVGQAIANLEAALRLARKTRLPGEQISILSALLELYEQGGESEKAQSVRLNASSLAQTLGETIPDGETRRRFLAAARERFGSIASRSKAA